MALIKPTLAAAIAAIGHASVYTGNPFTVGGLALLGVIEGEVSFTEDWQTNDLTTEQTGGVVHQRDVTLGNVTITAPVVFSDLAQYAKTHPLGLSGGGHSTPQPVVTTSVVIVPQKEQISAPLAYNGTAWTPAAPEHTVWMWRATVSRGPLTFARDGGGGGKRMLEVTFTGMWFDGAAVPEGHKVYTIGNPVTAGVTTLRV